VDFLGPDPDPPREVLESGPDRPAGDGLDRLARDARRWWRRSGPTGPWRRRAVATTAALAAAGVVVVLRATAPTVPLEDAAAADTTSAPAIVYGRARMQPPPFDRLPGRTPIPLPSPIGRPAEAVRGALPATGAIGERAAREAARLVLGRYCRYPQGFLVLLDGAPGWREATAIVLRRSPYLEQRRLTTLRLRWSGHSYAWQGWPAELARCS
jgi:hypothetical protein